MLLQMTVMHWARFCCCAHCASLLLHCILKGIGLSGCKLYIAACSSTCHLLSGPGNHPPPPPPPPPSPAAPRQSYPPQTRQVPSYPPQTGQVPVTAGSSSIERTAGGGAAAALRCVHAAAEGARCPAAGSPAGACQSEGHLAPPCCLRVPPLRSCNSPALALGHIWGRRCS